MADKLTILIVEDEPIIRLDIADFLSTLGYRILEASNADDAVRMLEGDASIRLIITDIEMPGSMDGLKLAAAVADRWPPIRIIVVSGQRAIDPRELPVGSEFFTKPYSHDAVGKIVATMLN